MSQVFKIKHEMMFSCFSLLSTLSASGLVHRKRFPSLACVCVSDHDLLSFRQYDSGFSSLYELDPMQAGEGQSC